MSSLRTETLSEVVAGALRQALHDGAYICGERLTELTIAHEMNVSQNTVRDALRILEGEGWVVKRPRYGVYVRSFSAEQVSELYALRAALETLALGWACAAARNDELARLKQAIHETRDQVEMGNSYAAREALLRFHTGMIEIAAKPQTARILARLFNQSRLLENLRETHMPRSIREWRATVDAYETLYRHIDSGAVETAQALLHKSIMADGETLSPVLELIAGEDAASDLSRDAG